MAKKITEIDSVTTPVDANLLYVITETDTIPLSKKITWANIKSTLQTFFATLFEDITNKKTSLADNSDTYYPTQKAVKTAVDAKQDTLGYTPEDVANKSTSVDTDKASDTKYPSVKAVYDWAIGLFQTLSNLVTAFQGTPDDTHYPSERLVKDSLDSKQDTMTKAAGTDIDTGTDDEKYTTSKAIKDSGIVSTDQANEFSGLTEKEEPADDDLILIEDSEASGVKKKVKKSALGGEASFIYYLPPTTNNRLIGGDNPSSLDVFNALGLGANDGKIKASIDGTVYDNIAINLRYPAGITETKYSNTSTSQNPEATGGLSKLGTTEYPWTSNFSGILETMKLKFENGGSQFNIRLKLNGVTISELLNVYGGGETTFNMPDVYVENGIKYTISVQSISSNNMYMYTYYTVVVGHSQAIIESYEALASILQTSIRTATGGSETVNSLGGVMVITSGTVGGGAILKLMTPSTGTDISGAGAIPYLDCASNATENADKTGSSEKVVKTREDGIVDDSLLESVKLKGNQNLSLGANTISVNDWTMCVMELTSDSSGSNITNKQDVTIFKIGKRGGQVPAGNNSTGARAEFDGDKTITLTAIGSPTSVSAVAYYYKV